MEDIQNDTPKRAPRKDCTGIGEEDTGFGTIIKVDFRFLFRVNDIREAGRAYDFITNTVLATVLDFVSKILSIRYGECLREEKILILLMIKDIDIPDPGTIGFIGVGDDRIDTTLSGVSFRNLKAILPTPDFSN